MQSATIGAFPNFANTKQYKMDYMPIAKQRVFFYMLFGNSQNADGSAGSGGVAEVSGAVSLITLGSQGTQSNANILANYQAATIMHELGHNRGSVKRCVKEFKRQPPFSF
jgi:hypothetical protein